ncbi:DUF2971 domain-containing protein [Rhodococcus hoagii]|nr:DUF2971 domain-containing protein [Prescottella equi]NKZ72004.1 DUF2971 domain-containing protein [Prescottella equi]
MEAHLPETVYHYTDIYGLQGIYENSELWATSSRFLNDSSEAMIGIESLRTYLFQEESRLLKEQISVYKSAEGRGQTVSDSSESLEELSRSAEGIRKLKLIREAADHVGNYIDCFITSLSEVRDQLSQWRGYARDGYCIGFSTERLCSALGEDFELRKVTYTDGEAAKGEYLKQISAIVMNLAESTTVVNEEHRVRSLRSAIRSESAFLKDDRFSEERELRIVPFGIISPSFFTPGRYGMTPRVKISIPRNSITEVTVGPGAHEKLKARSLIEYFHHTAIRLGEDWNSTPKVRRSTIPYRDW